MVTLKEFDYSVEGIDMVIGGAHGINSDMDYNITAKVPRKLLEKNAVGAAADRGIKFLEGQASKLGINFATGEFINVKLNIGGSMTNPKVKLNLLGTANGDSSIKDVVENLTETAIDSVKTVATEKFNEAKDSVLTVVEDKKAELTAEANKKIQSLLADAEKQAKKYSGRRKRLSGKTRKEGYKQADDLIAKAGNNIFKKKGAEIAANKLRKETDKSAEKIISEGESKAQNVLDIANKKAKDIRAEYGIE